MDISAVRRGRISWGKMSRQDTTEMCLGLGWQEQDPERKPSIYKDAVQTLSRTGMEETAQPNPARLKGRHGLHQRPAALNACPALTSCVILGM